MLSTKLTTVYITVDCVALDYVVLKIWINGLAGRYFKKKIISTTVKQRHPYHITYYVRSIVATPRTSKSRALGEEIVHA
jgi:hypothetical protein